MTYSAQTLFHALKVIILRSRQLFRAQTDFHATQLDFRPLKAIITRSTQLLPAQTYYYPLRAINLRSDRFQHDVT